MEQVVAGMRVAVERVQPVKAAKDEAVDRLGREVLLVLVPDQELVKRRAGHELAGQDARGAELEQDVRHPDHRVAVVIARKHLLALRLADVVDLFLKPRAKLVYQRAHIKARERGAHDAL